MCECMVTQESAVSQTNKMDAYMRALNLETMTSAEVVDGIDTQT